MSEAEDNKAITENELVLGFRLIDYPGKGRLRIYRPTTLITEQADLAYSAKRRALLMEKDPAKKLLTQKQLTTILEESGDWTKSDSKQLSDIYERLLLSELDRAQTRENLKSANQSDKPELEKKLSCQEETIKNLWNEYVNKMTERDTLFNDCVEHYAALERRLFLLVSCIKDEYDKQLWTSTSDIRGEKLENLRRLIDSAIRFWNQSASKESVSFFDPSQEGGTPESAGELPEIPEEISSPTEEAPTTSTSPN